MIKDVKVGLWYDNRCVAFNRGLFKNLSRNGHDSLWSEETFMNNSETIEEQRGKNHKAIEADYNGMENCAYIQIIVKCIVQNDCIWPWLDQGQGHAN